MSDESKLNYQQTLFCHEYIIDLNATKAAERAGYSAHTAQEQGSRLLSIVMVKDKVQELMDRRTNRLDITADLVLDEIRKLATVDLSQAYDRAGRLLHPTEMPEEVRKAIAGIEVMEEYEGKGQERTAIGQTKKVKFYDKAKALELLGKHLVLFSEKHIHEGKITLEDLVSGSNKKPEDKK
ncbi:MAG: terminase small subunit [Nitrosomonas sp.]|nr:terminase small subunit [Nitrosomonas sp.]